MARILVGTCSWTDPSLIRSGAFYPLAANTPEKRLRYYAQQFPTVEVDSPYYALPSPRTAQLWASRTPKHFTFDVKAFSLFTHHPTQVKALPRELQGQLRLPEGKTAIYYNEAPEGLREVLWQQLMAALAPLARAEKLGVVMFQFPPWFRPSGATHQYLKELPQRLPAHRIAIEFRHSSWLDRTNRGKVLDLLHAHGLNLVCVDEPQGLASSLPRLAEATGSVAVVRFHGRNASTWEKPGIIASERFRYLYSEEELAGWTPRIHYLAEQTEEVHVLMNNCYQDHAVRNAWQMVRLLGVMAGGSREQLPLIAGSEARSL